MVRQKTVSAILTFTVLIGLITLATYLKRVADYKQTVSEISIEEINILDIPDGVYVGECDANYIYTKVEVTVHSKKITSIRIIEHKNERGRAAEAVLEEIISEQRIDVDAISGATNSSIVLKKAVEKALKND